MEPNPLDDGGPVLGRSPSGESLDATAGFLDVPAVVRRTPERPEHRESRALTDARAERPQEIRSRTGVPPRQVRPPRAGLDLNAREAEFHREARGLGQEADRLVESTCIGLQAAES